MILYVANGDGIDAIVFMYLQVVVEWDCGSSDGC